MTRIEFRHRETSRLIVQVERSPVLPLVGDRIYAPSASDIGVYDHLRVTGRAWYYDQHGNLALVSLECEAVSS